MLDKYLNKVHNADSLDFMKKLPDNCIDAIVTDPPYELGFMGKKWDKTGIAYNIDLWRECLRILNAGGHLLAFGGTRTYHRMACAIEDAGFEIRDQIQWLYGSGFPKSLNISKAIDKKFGAEREVVRKEIRPNGKQFAEGNRGFKKGEIDITAPATLQAKQYDGWGSALKPAHEPICMARKPIAEKTIADNVLKYGTGGINIDQTRIKTNEKLKFIHTDKTSRSSGIKGNISNSRNGEIWENNKGRFPSNVILSHHPECVEIGFKEVKDTSGKQINSGLTKTDARSWKNSSKEGINRLRYGNENGKETVPHYECHPDCPIGILDKQSGISKSSGGSGEKTIKNANPYFVSKLNEAGTNLGGLGDTGTASRFFYCAKPSRAERNKGCENLEEKITNDGRIKDIDNAFQRGITKRTNSHPTVKSKKLMQYLIKMITPKGSIVLDCFAGSGSTLVACKSLGFDFIGIEKEKEYCKIAEARIKAEQVQGKLF